MTGHFIAIENYSVLETGLTYNSTDIIYWEGCVYPLEKFINQNTNYILSPIIITVSAVEILFLTVALFTKSSQAEPQYLK